MGYLRLQIEKSFPYLLAVIPLYLLLRFIVLRRRKKVDAWRELVLLAGVSYLVVLLRVTVIPDWGFIDRGNGDYWFYIGISPPWALNLIPFKTVRMYLQGDFPVNPGDVATMSFANLAGNLLLLAPLGFLLPVLNEKARSWKRTLVVGAAFSVVMETVQYFIGRIADVDDVILNSLGALLGYSAWKVLSHLWKRNKSEK